jgi:hypothetical protein
MFWLDVFKPVPKKIFLLLVQALEMQVILLSWSSSRFLESKHLAMQHSLYLVWCYTNVHLASISLQKEIIQRVTV